ncbi:STE3-like pheromone receptor [Tricholoma matsutake]|nr:STE3-like pheromone receptor [Tricholoma matsutake 945]
MPLSQDPTYPLFPLFSSLGFLVTLIPLPWHIQAWNSGTCAFMIWTSMTCLIESINSLVWRGNVQNPAPIWCDISSKLEIGASIGIPASMLCISRRLYNITALQTASVTREDKRRSIIVDLCITVGVPVLAMILHVIVQPHRFDILEDVGCYAVIYNTLPAYFLYFSWPVVLGLVSFVYSGLTLRSFWIRRVQFNQLLSSNSSMNISRYLRLILLALIDIVLTIPLSIYSIYIANKGVGMAPWISWQDTHFNFGRVGLVPALIWRGDRSFETSVELTRWLPVFCAFIFFALFGFAAEAQKHYSLFFRWVAKLLNFNAQSSTGAKINASLPG